MNQIDMDRIRSFLDHANNGNANQIREEINRDPLLPLDVIAGNDVYEGRTALHLAAMNGHENIVSKIINSGRCERDVVNATDRYGLTPLHLAVRGPARPPARSSGCWRKRVNRRRAAQVAPPPSGPATQIPTDVEQQQRVNVVRIFTRSSWVLPDRFIGASGEQDEARFNCEGFTPLHFAAVTGNIAIVKLLLRQNKCREETAYDPVNIHATTWQGQSPLDVAKEHNHKKLVELLECFDVNWLRAELEKAANSQNAILLGAALVATLSFGCWLQPPLGIPDPDPSSNALPHLTPEVRSKNEAYFFLLIAPSLTFSLAALMTGTLAIIPPRGVSLKTEVHHLRKSVHATAILLFMAIIFLTLAAHIASVLVFKSVAFENEWVATAGEKAVQVTSLLCLLYMVVLAFTSRRVLGWKALAAISVTVASLLGFGVVMSIITSATSKCHGDIHDC